MCMKANMPVRYRNTAYFTMLKGAALDHYDTNLRKHAQIAELEDLTWVTKRYFESKEYQRNLINYWNNVFLESVIERPENSGKSITDCLQLLLEEMRHLKLGLPKEMQSNVIFHTRLLAACQDFPPCVYACCKPSDNISALIEELETVRHTTKGGSGDYSRPQSVQALRSSDTGCALVLEEVCEGGGYVVV
jgi:hypothetical protein